MTVQELQEFANELIEVGKGQLYSVGGCRLFICNQRQYRSRRQGKRNHNIKKSQYIEREEKRNKKRLIKEEAQK